MAKLKLQLRSVCLYRLIQRSQVDCSVPNLGLQHFCPLHALVMFQLKLTRAPRAAGSSQTVPSMHPCLTPSSLARHCPTMPTIEDAK